VHSPPCCVTVRFSRIVPRFAAAVHRAPRAWRQSNHGRHQRMRHLTYATVVAGGARQRRRAVSSHHVDLLFPPVLRSLGLDAGWWSDGMDLLCSLRRSRTVATQAHSAGLQVRRCGRYPPARAHTYTRTSSWEGGHMVRGARRQRCQNSCVVRVFHVSLRIGGHLDMRASLLNGMPHALGFCCLTGPSYRLQQRHCARLVCNVVRCTCASWRGALAS
jgi:hypothetical protein